MSRRADDGVRWSLRVGADPYLVHAFERPERGGAAYAAWVDPDLPGRDRRRTRSLGMLVRTADGELDPALVDEAEARVLALHAALFPAAAAAAVPPPGGWLTLADGLARALAPGSGAFARSPRYQRTAGYMADRLTALLGATTPWDRLDANALAAGWRALAREHRTTGRGGPTAALHEFIVLFTAAAWLRAEHLIPPGAGVPPPRWRARLAADWRAIAGGAA